MTAIDRFQSALEAHGCEPHGSREHIDSLCPAHYDRHPSLSVDQRGDKLLVKCHAGCPIENVLDALGLALRDLFDGESTNGSQKQLEILAIYDYRDEHGALLYQVVRYSPKDFKQRRPDGAGGWIWKLGDVQRVLFRLPELLAGIQSGRQVLIVEGEKDVDRLISEGFIVTCNSGGAGKFLTEFAHYFKGANVVILPDNDEAGRKHAQQIAEMLEGVAGETRIVELPGLPEHGDVSNWLGAGWNADQLKAIIDSTPSLGSKSHKDTSSEAPVLPTGELLHKVRSALERFVVFSNGHQSAALALWVLHTHVFDCFDTTPYIEVSSPTKQAGKTRLFEVLAELVARPWSAIEATEAVLFRKIALITPTLLLDEIDAAFGKDSTLTEGIRAILNAGYRRGASVSRCSGSKYELKDFPVYCPKAFAGIGNKLPDTVRDRSIPIELRRRAPSDPKPDRLRRSTSESDLRPIGLEVAAWGAANRDQLAEMRPELPDELSDRQQDAWEPLFAIAKLAGGEWLDLAREAAIVLHGGVADHDVGMLLLRNMRDLFNERDTDALATKTILTALVNRDDDSPWAHWWGDDVQREQTKGPGSRLARLLKPYQIEPKTIRIDGATSKGYSRADFDDAWSRYLPSSHSSSPSSPAEDGTTEHRRSETVSDTCPCDTETAPEQDCYVVTSPSQIEPIQTSPGLHALYAHSQDVNNASPGDNHATTAQDCCISCGQPVTPAASSVEHRLATVCRSCSEADR
jgi:hypothetical protein